MPPILIALAVLAVVIAAVAVGVRAAARAIDRRSDRLRAEALAGPAAQLGLTPLAALPGDLPPFELLNTGKDRRASNVMRGLAGGADTVVFDYTYFDKFRTYHGLHYFKDMAGATVVCVKDAWLALPPFVMEPSLGAAVKQFDARVDEQLGDGAMGAAARSLISVAEGIADAQPGWRFGDAPEVPYRVRGDELAVRPMFTPPVLDYFRSHSGWIVEGHGNWLLVTFPWRFRQPAPSREQASADSGLLPADRLTSLVRGATGALEVFRGP